MSGSLQAQVRNNAARSHLSSLRQQGRVPGVLYGMDKGNLNISVDQIELLQLLRQHGKNSILELNVGGQNERVVIAEIQKDNLKDRIVHLDLKRVNMNKPMIATVPISLIGQAEGVKQGGVVQFQTREVEVRCLPSALPESIPVYVSELKIGESLTVQDLDIPEGVEVQHEPSEVIISIAAPRLQPVEEDNGDEIQEPEVVGAKDGPGMDEAK